MDVEILPLTVVTLFDGNTFLPGEVVTGKVVVQLFEPVTLTGLRIYFHGMGKVSWSSLIKASAVRKVYLSQAQELLHRRINLYSSLALQPGMYSYPFSLSLPSNLPSSFESTDSYVRYKAKTTIEGSWRSRKLVFETYFHVSKLLDLNREPQQLKEPCQTDKEIDMSTTCCASGTISVDVHINRRCFVPGEKIITSGTINNQTNSVIRKTTFSILQKMTFHKLRMKREIKKTIANVDLFGSEMTAYSSKTWNNVELSVPLQLPVSVMAADSTLSIQYWIQVTVAFRFPFARVSTKLKQIVIGNVPLGTHVPTSRLTTHSPTLPNRTTGQRRRQGSWGTQWDMIPWMAPLENQTVDSNSHNAPISGAMEEVDATVESQRINERISAEFTTRSISHAQQPIQLSVEDIADDTKRPDDSGDISPIIITD